MSETHKAPPGAEKHEAIQAAEELVGGAVDAVQGEDTRNKVILAIVPGLGKENANSHSSNHAHEHSEAKDHAKPHDHAKSADHAKKAHAAGHGGH